MNDNAYKFWKCAIFYIGGMFRHLTDKHLNETFNPRLLYDDFNDLYNHILEFDNVFDLHRYMHKQISDINFKKLLMKRIYSKIYNNSHKKRISKYKNYFSKNNYPHVSIALNFPEKIFSLTDYVPKTLNDFLLTCGIFDTDDIIGLYFYSYFFSTKFSGRESKTRLRSCIEDSDKIDPTDPFLFWCEIANISITNIDYPIYPNNIDELTDIEKIYDKFTNTSFEKLKRIYGEKDVLDQIYDLRLNHYYATKIVETEYIQTIIHEINKIIIDIYELLKSKCSKLILYPLNVININDEICFNDKINNKYISPIFYEELENYRCCKLSDGYCYSVSELYKLTNYTSPMTRIEFNEQDIGYIKYIKSNYIG